MFGDDAQHSWPRWGEYDILDAWRFPTDHVQDIYFKTSGALCWVPLDSLTFRVTFFLNRDLRWHVRPSQGVDSYAGLCILDEGEGFQNVEPRCNYSLDSTSNVALKLKRKLPVSVSPRMEKGRPPP